MGKLGVMVCGHGSRDVGAVDEFTQLVSDIRRRLPKWPVESGFLEFAHPVIRDGLDSLRQQGVDHILAVPGMLFAAGHVKNDVPSVLNGYAKEHGIKIDFGRDLGIDPKLLKASKARIDEALEGAGGDVALEDTLLAVIGRGTSDPDANGNVCKLARMLWEGTGVGWAEVGYSGVAHPRVDEALERAIKLGFKRIVVFPYFLFTGVLIRRIYDQTDEVAARYPEIEFIKAGYLNNQPLVVETFIDRIEGILEDDVDMNCLLCRYREQIIGHEGAAGAPQEGHHHHVEGIGTDGHHHHHHHHGHGHHHEPANQVDEKKPETTAAE